MNRLEKTIGYVFAVTLLLAGCLDDKGNYDYDFDSVEEIKIDTSGIDATVLYGAWNVGDVKRLAPKVTYSHPERLAYYWLMMDAHYAPVTVGNSEVYPPADTIGREAELEYTIALEPGNSYQLWFVVRDTVTENMASLQLAPYLSVPEEGKITGIYCLQEKEGRLDIDILGTPFGLIYNYEGTNEYHVEDYWSTMHADRPLQGEDGLIYTSGMVSGGGDWIYIFTPEEGMRCSPAMLTVMDTWEEMFYSAPVYKPEAVVCENNCDFLINDGKLHCLYVQQAGDRKFLNPVGENLAPFLATQTRSDYGQAEGAIDAYQILFDYSTNGYKAFYNQGSELIPFNPSISGAFDVNALEGELVYEATVGSDGETMAIMERDGGYYLDVACFVNVPDNGNLARRSLSLSGCQGIGNATCFIASPLGPTFFYGSGKTLYSFTYTTGQREAKAVWTGEAGDEITCLYINMGGGWPNAGKVLWAAVWNEQKQEGKVVELEYSPETGEIDDMWAGMMMLGSSPNVYEGFGRIVSMTSVDM